MLCVPDEYTRQRLLLTTHFRYTFLKERQLNGQEAEFDKNVTKWSIGNRELNQIEI